MNRNPTAGRRPSLAITGLLAVAGTVLVLAFPGAPRSRAESAHVDHRAVAGAMTDRRAAFHDAMRKLWEDHVTWTRLAIISLAHDLPDLQATEDRLLRNQSDIGDAVKPYYGKAAGNRLTALLREHILGAVALLQAAKAGDRALIEQRSAAWYANGDEIAGFLHGANPRNWSRKTMRRMMKTHLDQTLQEAVDRLEGDYAADIRDYDEVHRHILEMADMLSMGIIKQFPRRFR